MKGCGCEIPCAHRGRLGSDRMMTDWHECYFNGCVYEIHGVH